MTFKPRTSYAEYLQELDEQQIAEAEAIRAMRERDRREEFSWRGLWWGVGAGVALFCGGVLLFRIWPMIKALGGW